MRWVLVIFLVNGLVPALVEAAEAVVHVAVEGHAPHGAKDPCDEDRGGEHGCGTTLHQCGCCPSQVMAPREVVRLAAAELERGGVEPLADQPVAREPSRPFRPPIG